jgi:ubiquinone/menaquinone biosynthesis C-methylase UbiE
MQPSSSTSKPPQVTPERLMQFAFGYAPPIMISTAVELGVFDALDKGPKTPAELAKSLNASERGLRSLMNGLTGFEFLSKDGDRYSLTPESSTYLVSSKPSYYGALYRRLCSRHLQGWLHLADAVRTGRPVQDAIDTPKADEFFKELVPSLFPVNYAPAQALAKALTFSAGQPRVLDLAAGSGVWGIAVAQQHPQARVTAVDLEGVIPVTRETVARFGLEKRFDFVTGDVLKADLGTGHSLAIIGHLLHGLGAKESQHLIRRVADALAPGGTIAIAEYLVKKDRTGPPFALVFAVNMLLHSTEGDTFSFEEISGWLREAGFENPRQVEAPGPSPLVLATKRAGAA